MFSLTYQELEYILDRLSQFYIANEDYFPFLESMNFTIPLNEFLCFCYGADYSGEYQNPRKIEVFQFLGQLDKNKGYYIQSFDLPDLDALTPRESFQLNPSNVYRITDCNQLRQHIFNFHDKTSLFRSTLFYVPSIKKLYRIHCLISFLTLPLYQNGNIEEIEKLSEHTITPQKFLIPLQKKKQILERLQHSLRLCEASIKAHGSVEQSIPESGHKK